MFIFNKKKGSIFLFILFQKSKPTSIDNFGEQTKALVVDNFFQICLSVEDDLPLENEVTQNSKYDESQAERDDIVRELLSVHCDFLQEL